MKILIKRLLALGTTLLALTALAACGKSSNSGTTASSSSAPKAAATANSALYRNFYEIFPSEFAASTPGGQGTLNGITAHLDYLNTGKPATTTDLKVGGIWLTPIYPTETYHGYDVTNYEAINPKLGTMADFENLIAQAKKRGIAVILDMVFNHTSIDHPWFQAALKGEKPYVAYYNWSDTAKPNYVKASNGKYYEAQFDPSMPDLNLANPAVKAQLAKVLKFWLDKGVSGFRFDAVGFYFSKPDKSCDDAKTTAFTKWLVQTVKGYDKNAYMVGEVFMSPIDITDIYTSGIDSLFDFPNSVKGGLNSPIGGAIGFGNGNSLADSLDSWDQQIYAANPTAIDAPILSNHDMDRSSSVFQSLAEQKMAAQTYLFMPGNPFIYYGEELGMNGEGIDQNKRLPMQWGTNSNASQTPGATETATTDGGNVAQQEADPNSLLNWYKKILRLKAKYPAIASSRIKAVDMLSASQLSILNYDKTLTIISNYDQSGAATTVTLPSSVVGKKIADQLSVTGGTATLVGNKLTIPAFTTVILTK